MSPESVENSATEIAKPCFVAENAAR
ncbi:hypothetical protein V2J09_016884 [Rumex salicifolius]